MHAAPRTLAALVAAPSACLLTGCTVSLNTGSGTPSTRAAAPASAGIATPDVPAPVVSTPSVPTDQLPSDGSSPAGSPTAGAVPDVVLPPGFPLPGGASATSGVNSGDEIDAVITVQDAASAAAFWKRALPGAGYTVISSDSGFGMYEVRFSGHGCVDNSQLAITGSSAALQCDLG